MNEFEKIYASSSRSPIELKIVQDESVGLAFRKWAELIRGDIEPDRQKYFEQHFKQVLENYGFTDIEMRGWKADATLNDMRIIGISFPFEINGVVDDMDKYMQEIECKDVMVTMSYDYLTTGKGDNQ